MRMFLMVVVLWYVLRLCRIGKMIMPSPLYSLTRSGQKTRVLRSFESHIWRNGHPFQPKRTISRSPDEPCFHRSIIISAPGHGLQHRAESVLSAARMDRSLFLRSWRACSGGFPFGESGNVLWFRYSIYKVHSAQYAIPLDLRQYRQIQAGSCQCYNISL